MMLPSFVHLRGISGKRVRFCYPCRSAVRAGKAGKESSSVAVGVKAAMSKFQGMSLEKVNEPEREVINSVVLMNDQLVTCGAINGELLQWQI